MKLVLYLLDARNVRLYLVLSKFQNNLPFKNSFRIILPSWLLLSQTFNARKQILCLASSEIFAETKVPRTKDFSTSSFLAQFLCPSDERIRERLLSTLRTGAGIIYIINRRFHTPHGMCKKFLCPIISQ